MANVWSLLLSRHVADGAKAWYFKPTIDEGRIANATALWVSVGCTILSFLVCAWAAALYSKKRLRHHFSRISTRLLLVCVVVTIIFGISVASTTIHWRDGQEHQKSCRVQMWFVSWSFNFINWLQGCISLNLIFALYKPTIFRKPIVRWYYASALLIAFVLATVPAILNKYRWTSQYSCWVYSTDDPSDFDFFQLVVIEAPLVLVTVLMFVSWIMVVVRLYVKKRNGETADEMLNQLYEPVAPVEDVTLLHGTERVGHGSRLEITEREFNVEHSPTKLKKQILTPSVRSPNRSFYSGRHKRRRGQHSSPACTASPHIPNSILSDVSSASKDSIKRPNFGLGVGDEANMTKMKVLVARLPMVYDRLHDTRMDDQKKLRHTVIRISLYPLMHLIVALLGACSQLMLENAEQATRRYQVSLYVTNFIGSAWVPLAYSLCLLFADTSLWEATVEWWQYRYASSDDIENLDLESSLGRNAHLSKEGRLKIKNSPPGHNTPGSITATTPNPTWLNTHIQVEEARKSTTLDLIEEDPLTWIEAEDDDSFKLEIIEEQDDDEEDDDDKLEKEKTTEASRSNSLAPTESPVSAAFVKSLPNLNKKL